MPPTQRRLVPVAAGVLALALHTLAHAQGAAPADVTGSASVAGYIQFNAPLDDGGRVNWAGGQASATVTRQFTPAAAAGLVVRYGYQSWNFNEPTAFGGVAPWGDLSAPSVGVNFAYTYGSDLLLQLSPTVQWAYESGAKTSDALTYGAVASISKVFSPDLVLGLGVSVFRRIDKTQALPFFIVNWKINDQWRVANPFEAGPVGGAGLEFIYAPDDRWEFAEGLSYRSYRFRLAQSGPTPDGIGENSFIPLFLRVSRKLTKELRLDFYAALATAGKLSVDNSDGSGRYSDDYKIAPAVGATLALRF